MNIASERKNLFTLISMGVLPDFVAFLKVPDIEVWANREGAGKTWRKKHN